jgi:hypothetical protein
MQHERESTPGMQHRRGRPRNAAPDAACTRG